VYYDTFHRGLTFTLSGVYSLCLILFVGLIAITTGINGLFVFLSCGLGGFVVSGVLSERAIRNILVTSIGAVQCDADETFTLYFSIENRSSAFTIFGMETLLFKDTPRYRLVVGKRHPIAHHRLMTLSPKSKVVVTTACPGLNRGYYDHLKAMNLTTFPLGILEKYKITKIQTKIVVSPKIDLNWLRIISERLSKIIKSFDMGAEFYIHQPYRNENPKLLDWRKNAGKKTNFWVIKDLRSETKKFSVLIDIRWSDTFPMISEEAYEAFLSRIRTAIEAAQRLNLGTTLRVDKKACIDHIDNIKLILAKAPPFEDRRRIEFHEITKPYSYPKTILIHPRDTIYLRITESNIEIQSKVS
jgi:uncharacterized protein (DUF58 family)